VDGFIMGVALRTLIMMPAMYAAGGLRGSKLIATSVLASFTLVAVENTFAPYRLASGCWPRRCLHVQAVDQDGVIPARAGDPRLDANVIDAESSPV
jgi:hypothetical protein